MWISDLRNSHTRGALLSTGGYHPPEVHQDHDVHRDTDDQQDEAEAGRPGPTCQGGLDDTPPVRCLQWASPFTVGTASTPTDPKAFPTPAGTVLLRAAPAVLQRGWCIRRDEQKDAGVPTGSTEVTIVSARDRQNLGFCYRAVIRGHGQCAFSRSAGWDSRVSVLCRQPACLAGGNDTDLGSAGRRPPRPRRHPVHPAPRRPPRGCRPEAGA